jgi:uncharacterized membrane protein
MAKRRQRTVEDRFIGSPFASDTDGRPWRICGDSLAIVPTNAVQNTERTGQALERVVFFSDAVIAIAITLLGLELRMPGAAGPVLWAHLRILAPTFFSFVISFAVIGLFWEAHHRLFTLVERYDRALIWLNLLFLFFIVLVPFSTSILGRYWSSAAVVLYAGTLAATGIARVIIVMYVVRKQLIRGEVDPETMRAEKWRAFVVPIIFLASMAVAAVSSTVAPLCWILLAPASVLGRRWISHHPVSPPE